MNRFRIGEFCKRVSITPQTARKWERDGKIHPLRTVGGHRIYSDANVDEALIGNKQTKLINVESIDSLGRDIELALQNKAVVALIIGGTITNDIKAITDICREYNCELLTVRTDD